MDLLRELEGCPSCGGVLCDENGCPDQAKSFRVNRRNPQQDHPKNTTSSPEKSSTPYRKTRHRPVIDTSAETPRAPERRGDPALWEKFAPALAPSDVLRMEAFGASPAKDGERVVIDFPRDYAEKPMSGLRRPVQAALGLPVVFRYARHEGL